MAITADAPRGGVVEEIDGVTYTFLLQNREIERFEDKHRGIFEVWDGFFDCSAKPTSKEVKDLIALALGIDLSNTKPKCANSASVRLKRGSVRSHKPSDTFRGV